MDVIEEVTELPTDRNGEAAADCDVRHDLVEEYLPRIRVQTPIVMHGRSQGLKSRGRIGRKHREVIGPIQQAFPTDI